MILFRYTFISNCIQKSKDSLFFNTGGVIDFYYGNRFCFTDWKGDGHIDILLSDYDVYTAEGRFVATAFHGYETAGARTRQWNVAGLPAGVYLIRLSADGRVRSRRLLVVR